MGGGGERSGGGVRAKGAGEWLESLCCCAAGACLHVRVELKTRWRYRWSVSWIQTRVKRGFIQQTIRNASRKSRNRAIGCACIDCLEIFGCKV